MSNSQPTTSKSRAWQGDYPSELSFENIIKNRAVPPCSLNDFMDYLVHVERSPEPLQFFLWYWDYLERWSSLSPEQKALSPPWNSDQTSESQSRFIRYSHKRERSLKLSKIIAIMEMDSQRAAPETTMTSSSLTAPPPATCTTTAASGSTTTKDNQPFRDELDFITTHYINPTSPHHLRLPESDLNSCLRALEETTHPSSLLPAFLTADATLRLHSHPNFLCFARSNANTPRIHFLRYVGSLLVVLGVLVDVLLIMSHLSSYLRVICLGFWWPGLVVLVAAGRGVCVGLAWRGVRQVRPWEGSGGSRSEDRVEKGEGVGAITRSVVVEGEVQEDGGEAEAEKGVTWREHTRAETGSSVVSVGNNGMDSLGKPGLRFLDLGNDHSTEFWEERYSEKGLMHKVFDETVPVRNKALVMWHDRTVLIALLWGAAGATALAVASLFVPSARLF